jgi:hypothetical protein
VVVVVVVVVEKRRKRGTIQGDHLQLVQEVLRTLLVHPLSIEILSVLFLYREGGCE